MGGGGPCSPRRRAGAPAGGWRLNGARRWLGCGRVLLLCAAAWGVAGARLLWTEGGVEPALGGGHRVLPALVVPLLGTLVCNPKPLRIVPLPPEALESPVPPSLAPHPYGERTSPEAVSIRQPVRNVLHLRNALLPPPPHVHGATTTKETAQEVCGRAEHVVCLVAGGSRGGKTKCGVFRAEQRRCERPPRFKKNAPSLSLCKRRRTNDKQHTLSFTHIRSCSGTAFNVVEAFSQNLFGAAHLCSQHACA